MSTIISARPLKSGDGNILVEGACGDNVSCTLSDNGTLTITGDGKINIMDIAKLYATVKG